MRGYLGIGDKYINRYGKKLVINNIRKSVWDLVPFGEYYVILVDIHSLTHDGHKVSLSTKETKWKIKEYKEGFTIYNESFIDDRLTLSKHGALFHLEPEIFTVGTYNLGLNIIMNIPEKSEGKLVKKCMQKYGAPESGEISQCSKNALQLMLTDFRDNNGNWMDIIGLQEVSNSYYKELVNYISRITSHTNFAPNYNFYRSEYRDKSVLVIANTNTCGKGMQLKSYSICNDKDCRGIQAVWFPRIGLLFVNVHMPHFDKSGDIIRELENAIMKMRQDNQEIRPNRVILVGDFNDGTGELRDKSIRIFGKNLEMRGEPPLTCCYDSDYIYYGDYIYDSDNPRNVYLGMPREYERHNPYTSDHDPVVYIEIL